MEPALRLRAAYVAVRRDDRHLQLGVDPPHRVIVPDTSDVRRLLAELAHGVTASPQTLPACRALDDLLDAGLVVATTPGPTLSVTVDGPPVLADGLRPLLASIGGVALTGPADPVHLVVLLAEGPMPRERTDTLLRAGTPHLVVEGGPDSWTVGPLVVPGETACLRCVDAAHGEQDPRRGLVLDQLAHHHALPAPDPMLQAIALPWAARDVAAYASGGRPASLCTTSIIRREGPVETVAWARHPHCGCAWDLVAYH